MSGEQLDPKEKLMIEAMVKEWGKEMRSELALIRQRSGGREKGKVRQYSRCNYFGYVEYWGEDEKEEYIRPFVKPRSDSTSFVTPVWDAGGVVTKDEGEDPKMTVMEEVNEEVEEIEAPPGPLTLFSYSDLSVHNQVDDEEHLPENIFHAEDKEAEMVKSKEEKVETEENGSMHNSLLDQSDNLERVKNEEKSMDAMLCKENVWSTNDLDCQFPSIYSFVQAFDDISSDDAFHDVISIQGTEHQVKLEEINESETMKLGEEHKKQNFIPFDVEDGQDLRTNPLQEEGNDAARRSWISLYGPRIKDDMG